MGLAEHLVFRTLQSGRRPAGRQARLGGPLGRDRIRRTPLVRPDQPPPAEFGMVPLTVPETGRLIAAPSPQHRALAGLAAPPPGPVTLVSPASTPGRNTEIALVS